MTKLTSGLLALLLMACNNDAKVASAPETDSSSPNTATLPYSVPKTPDWERGPEENVAIAMGALKSYERNDSSQMVAAFADSIDFYYDGGEFKGTRDSFWTMMKAHRSTYKNVSVRMHDYESVKSKARGGTMGKPLVYGNRNTPKRKSGFGHDDG